MRLTLTITTDPVLDRWMLAPAARHDSATLADAPAETTDCLVPADGAYHNPATEALLLDRRNVLLPAPPRQDSTHPWPAARRLVNRVRRRIETALCILATVFDIEHPRARSLHGLVARINTRLLAYNLCFLMDKHLAQLPAQTQN